MTDNRLGPGEKYVAFVLGIIILGGGSVVAYTVWKMVNGQ